jgi:hypothetical protein
MPERGVVFKRCGCRDRRSGHRLEGACPQLAKRGHGSCVLPLLGAGRAGRARPGASGRVPVLSEAPARHGRPLTPASLHRIRATLGAALNAAMREGLLRDSPAHHVELRIGRRPPAQVWTKARVEARRERRERSTVAVAHDTHPTPRVHTRQSRAVNAQLNGCAARNANPEPAD